MTWQGLVPSPCGTHHTTPSGEPAYSERYDEVFAFHAPGLAPVRSGNEACHIRPDGTPAYPGRFARTFGFYEGLATVVGPDGWFHITPQGRAAYDARYSWCGNFQGGRCTVRQAEGEYLHVRPDGSPAYAPRWRYAGDYRYGVAVVQAADGRSTHIDASGAVLHSRWFLDLDVFHKGFARARDEDGWMHVDRDGLPAYGQRFASVEPFYNGQARVERFDGGLEVIDEQGHAMLELRPALRSEFAGLSSDLVGFWRTQTLGAAVESGVIEALPADTREVASRCETDGPRTSRLLRALAELGVVRRKGGGWVLTARGEYLRRAHPMTLADAAIEYARYFGASWARLPALLRAAGDEPADVFEEVAKDPARAAGHHRMLRSYARHDYVAVPETLDLSGDETVIDAGGGLGVLAELLARRCPRVRVVLLERPEVVRLVSVPADLAARIELREADLLRPWGVSGDAVVLSRVLHDWEDEVATRILRSARAALPRGGRVFVVEMILDEAGVAGGLCDLHLLAVTGGRERTAAQYSRLLRDSGFEVKDVRRLPALPSVIVGEAV